MFFNNNCLECSDSTLTVRHLLTALQGVADWQGLGQCLDVPWSRQMVMTEKESMLEEWLQNHPAPSWKLVAWALYRNWEGRLTGHNLLKQLYEKHVTGMWLCIQRKLVGQYHTTLSNMCILVNPKQCVYSVDRVSCIGWGL